MSKAAILWIGQDSDPELITDTDNYMDGVNTHPTEFPPAKVVPTMASILTLRGDFSDAMIVADGGGPSDTAKKDAKRALLEPALRDSVANIQTLSKGDRATLLLAVPVQKEHQPAGPVNRPQNLRLKHGENSGELAGRADPVDNAYSYEWRYATEAAPAAWQDGGTSTGARKTLPGLVPGTLYTVQVRAIGTSGRSDWSDPAVLRAV